MRLDLLISEKFGVSRTRAQNIVKTGGAKVNGVTLQKPVRGEIIAVAVTGAYNYSMASNYNRIPRPLILLLSGGKAKVAVRRESNEDMIKNEV